MIFFWKDLTFSDSKRCYENWKIVHDTEKSPDTQIINMSNIVLLFLQIFSTIKLIKSSNNFTK